MIITRKKHLLLYWLIPIMLVLSCSQRKSIKDGSNTNWLSYCEVSADCESNGACICGLCTKVCDEDAECWQGDQPATCVDPQPGNQAGKCAAVVKEAAVKICLPDCIEDYDCNDNSFCLGGACWPDPEGIADERGDDSSLETLESELWEALTSSYFSNDIDDMDAAVDFSGPIYLPDPKPTISGDYVVSSLVGVWEQSPDSTLPSDTSYLRLAIREASDGTGLTGTVTAICESGSNCKENPPPVATDPNSGYPPWPYVRSQSGSYSSDLISARFELMEQFDYRIFDARVEENRLSFWITANGLWRDWCALQPSYPVTNGSRLEYYCVADPKPAIGNNYWYGISMDTQLLESYSEKDLLCGLDNSVCSCDVDGCTVNYRQSVITFDLSLDDDVMQGTYIGSGNEIILIILYRNGV